MTDATSGEQGRLFAAPAGTAATGEAIVDGEIARVTFRSNDSAFTVARITVDDSGAEITVVGPLGGLPEGTPVRLRGAWVEDRRFGRQLKVERYEIRHPDTLVGIERYLGRGRIPGIGPKRAQLLVAHFGLDTLTIIESQPERLTEVAGIGPAIAKDIANAFNEIRREQATTVFLLGLGAAPSIADRIIRRYGDKTMAQVREHPYDLARDVIGVGFRMADGFAEKLGVARDAPARLAAGVVHVLGELAGDGHTHAPEDVMLERAVELLGVDRAKLAAVLDDAERRGAITREVLGDRGRTIALAEITAMEIEAAGAFAELLCTPTRAIPLDVDRAIGEFEVATGLALAPQQRAAVTAAAVDKCVVITGGPGVGKTTIIRAVVDLGGRMRRKIALAAPTGRAAKRLAEATRAEAMTLHRLLEYSPQTGQFAKNRFDPIEADLVIVDETSMVDLALFRALVIALQPGAQLVLVGDIDQLPSVGAGAVLGDVIASGAATVVRLTEIFRQAAQSKIVTSAHRINRGELPELDSGPAATDFYFIAREEPLAARDTVIELVAERIPARFGFASLRDIQVLVPMHKGDLGTTAFNGALQARLNPPRDGVAELRRGDRAFRPGDKVMQLKNDYDRNVFNGDIGVVDRVDVEATTLWVALPDRADLVEYQREHLDQLVHAYAVSIHKSQGSEYPAVIIALANQHFVMLGRSLLYTAVTRGKQLVIIVGSRRALSLAVKNETSRKRWTWLAERIRAAADGEP